MSDAKANDKLITAIDNAFDAPIREVSVQRPVMVASDIGLDAERLQELTPKSVTTGILAEPTTLLRDLRNLKAAQSPMHSVAFGEVNSARAINDWTTDVETRVRRVVYDQGLQHPATEADLNELLALTGQAHAITAEIESHDQATKVGMVAYAVERRVRVWQAVAKSLQNSSMSRGAQAPIYVTSNSSEPGLPPVVSSTGKPGFTADQVARENLHELVTKIEATLRSKPDGASWKKFLQLDDLLQWSSNPDADCNEGTNWLPPCLHV